MLRARFIHYVVHCTVGIYGGWGSKTFAIRVPCLTSSDDFRSFKICNGTQDNILFIIRFSFDSAKVKRRNHGPETPLFTFFCHLHFTADCLILFVFEVMEVTPIFFVMIVYKIHPTFQYRRSCGHGCISSRGQCILPNSGYVSQKVLLSVLKTFIYRLPSSLWMPSDLAGIHWF